jgi:enamine deaminase RidA (YjgF/YER057c/UK114 family)
MRGLTMRRRVSTGSPFETEFAYSRAVAQGDWCFVAGTTGYDYATMTMPEPALDQARNALATIARSLGEAGFALSDVVRVRYYLTDAALRAEIAPALREAFGAIRPAATMIVAALTEPEMLVEVEVTAFRG